MNAYDFVHLVFLALGKEVRGKTKLQKTVYFLGKLIGNLEELGYRPHYYGPYSSDVSESVDRLLTLGFVNETVASGGAVDRRGFEVARHDYKLSDEGKTVAQLKASRHPVLWKKLQHAVKTLERGGNLNYIKLSIAAKTDFMLERRHGRAGIDEAGIDELAKAARTFGWEVKRQEVSQAATFLEALGLVKVSPHP
jgi:uncharacterized protein YwgA